MNGADSIQIIAYDILGVGATHDVDENISGYVTKVGEDERRPVAVLIAVGKVVEGYEADGRLAFAIGRQREIDDLARKIQIDLVLALTHHEDVAWIGAHQTLVRHELGWQTVVRTVRFRLPTVDLVQLDDHATASTCRTRSCESVCTCFRDRTSLQSRTDILFFFLNCFNKK